MKITKYVGPSTGSAEGGKPVFSLADGAPKTRKEPVKPDANDRSTSFTIEQSEAQNMALLLKRSQDVREERFIREMLGGWDCPSKPPEESGIKIELRVEAERSYETMSTIFRVLMEFGDGQRGRSSKMVSPKEMMDDGSVLWERLANELTDALMPSLHKYLSRKVLYLLSKITKL